MRDIECLAGVVDLSVCGTAVAWLGFELEFVVACVGDPRAGGFEGSIGDACPCVRRSGVELVPSMPKDLVGSRSLAKSCQGLLTKGVSSAFSACIDRLVDVVIRGWCDEWEWILGV